MQHSHSLKYILVKLRRWFNESFRGLDLAEYFFAQNIHSSDFVLLNHSILDISTLL